jgi:hypothetical protein
MSSPTLAPPSTPTQPAQTPLPTPTPALSPTPSPKPTPTPVESLTDAITNANADPTNTIAARIDIFVALLYSFSVALLVFVAFLALPSPVIAC